ncbi:MAG: zinc-ribbon domain-containing protein [Bacteroidales bacterium]|nr:zinc-ribbon domain-containing protein [Bacteroidales bacterium]
MYCSKCGTENEDGAKFCKSCGTPLGAEPIQPNNSDSAGNTFQLVKKIVIWGVAFIVLFILGAMLITFVQEKNEENRIQDLRAGCTNNDAQACYELSKSLDYYDSGRNEALAKGCQLGNKDACREGGYHERGCQLQDGQSCFELTTYGSANPKLVGCQFSPDSYGCDQILKDRKAYEKKYYDLACQYGYSQGCMKE